jgi:hypothetical protein
MNTQLASNQLQDSSFTQEQIAQCRGEHKKAPTTSSFRDADGLVVELTAVIVSGPGGLGVQYWRKAHIMCGMRIGSDRSVWVFEDYL